MDVLIIIVLIVVVVIFFLVELFVILGISFVGILVLVCIIYVNYYVFVNLGIGVGFIIFIILGIVCIGLFVWFMWLKILDKLVLKKDIIFKIDWSVVEKVKVGDIGIMIIWLV